MDAARMGIVRTALIPDSTTDLRGRLRPGTGAEYGDPNNPESKAIQRRFIDPPLNRIAPPPGDADHTSQFFSVYRVL